MFSLAALAACVWIFPGNPATSSPRCEAFAYPPRLEPTVFSFKDEAYGFAVADVAASDGVVAADFMKDNPGLTPEVQRWAFRNVAHHLGLAHDFVRGTLRRRAPARPIEIVLTKEYRSQGLLNPPQIHLGGAAAFTSDIIYHEYGHHLIEWERPGLTKGRGTSGDNPEGYAIVEAYANHLAFVLDDEPRFGEYTQARLGGGAMYAYTVETGCSVKHCDQAVASYGATFPVVIGFGALLWDIKKQYGGAESLTLMLDSLRFIDLKARLTYKSAAAALVRSAEMAHGVDVNWLKERAYIRYGE